MSAIQPRQPKKDLQRERHTPLSARSDSSEVPVRNCNDGISGAEGFDSAIAHGVELGYRVIDQYVRQGQRAAERFNPANRAETSSYGSDTPSGDLRADLEELLERAVRFAISLIPQPTEVEKVLGWGTDFLRGVLSQWIRSPLDDVANGGALTDEARHLSVEAICSRPIRVTLDLRANSGQLKLTGDGMCAADSGLPPLGDVTFVDHEGRCPVVRIRVTDDQPAGIYTGVVADSQTGEPCGILSVQIGGDVGGMRVGIR